MVNIDSKKFTITIISISLVILGTFGLKAISLDGLNIKPIYSLFITMYLLFIPGLVIIKLLKFQTASAAKLIIYDVGLSISFLMFFGLFLNFSLPIFGFSNPLQEWILIISICTTIILTTILAYIFQSNFSFNFPLNFHYGPQIAAMSILVVLSALGAELINNYNINILTIVMFIIIAAMPILVARGKLNKNLYAIGIFLVALALLYHRSLISMYITGWDTQGEYFYANLVETNSVWFSSLPSNVNAMLSTCMFAPIFSKTTMIPLDWVFKLIYPFLYALSPVCMYLLLKDQFDDKIAFLSIFLVLSSFVFYQVMLDLPRQQMGELFLSLFLLTIISNDASNSEMSKKIISIIFLLSITVSHYGLSYIFLIILCLGWLMYRPTIQKTQEQKFIAINLILLYIIFCLSWYMYSSSSSVFNTVANIGNHVLGSISTEFLDPESSQAISITVSQSYPFHQVTKYLHFMVQLLIVIGVFSLFDKNYKYNTSSVYKFIAMSAFFWLVASILLPYFAAALSFNRIYQIAIILLSPFFVVGIFKFLELSNLKVSNRHVFNFIGIFLFIFLLFNSGIIYELSKEPSQMSLNGSIDYPRFDKQELMSLNWINGKRDNESTIYSDAYRSLLFKRYNIKVYTVDNIIDEIVFSRLPSNDLYLYFGKENVKIKRATLYNHTNQLWESRSILNLNIYNRTKKSNLIYENGDAAIYKVDRNQNWF